LRAGRYKIQFTASAALREKLERLQALMRGSGKDASLAETIEAAVDEQLKRLEARRLGLSRKPRKTVAQTDTAPHSRHVPAAIRRAVWRRDEGRCGFVDADGRRCTAVHALEFHHLHPYGLGGVHSVANTALRCRLHNAHLAEIDYGRRVRPRTSHLPLTHSDKKRPGPPANGASG
jgi:5-methylcytosine-specific restriction endonuclease McrA